MKINSISRTTDHRVNEDSLYRKELSSDCTLAVLADGMGGLSYGNIASQLICAKIGEVIEQVIDCIKPEEAILSSLKEADLCIAKESVSRKCKNGRSCFGCVMREGTCVLCMAG